MAPRAQAHGLGLSHPASGALLPSLSTQAAVQAWENCSMDAGSRRGVPTAPPPLGHLGWSWQHQVDQSWSMGCRKVAGQTMRCGLLRPEERLGALGPPGSPSAHPLRVLGTHPLPSRPGLKAPPTPLLHCLHPEAWHAEPSAGRP